MRTILLADPCVVTGYADALTPVYYGTAKPIGIAPGTNMAIRYHAGRATASLSGWSFGAPAGALTCRILHGDILVIGSHRFRVHCPDEWPARPPELHRITA
ncbi:hypothetical protein D5S18_24840 [Nocardia panacis]|uniref:Uncharacterized protein n=1 Tax=Nocardia panacis TaxID=2340916 RepID=A0A3A4K1J6_9NOCA|nr:hypothetical protein [Nocardia panacis]RJO71402.1 hypothetical protein D5S18_24840 [Nocardia panacis]